MLHEIDPEKHGPLGPEMAAAVSTCVHCGFCLAACPTYKVLGQETDSPRGRIVLMKEVLEGSLPLEAATPHLDPCLGCLACEPACPSGVAYRDLISPFRAASETRRNRPMGERFRRLLTRMTLPYPGRFRLAAQTGRFAKPLVRWLPKGMRVMLDLLPDRLPTRQTWDSVYPAAGTKRGRVALLTGCAERAGSGYQHCHHRSTDPQWCRGGRSAKAGLLWCFELARGRSRACERICRQKPAGVSDRRGCNCYQCSRMRIGDARVSTDFERHISGRRSVCFFEQGL